MEVTKFMLKEMGLDYEDKERIRALKKEEARIKDLRKAIFNLNEELIEDLGQISAKIKKIILQTS